MLSKQKTKQDRDLLNNPRIYQDIADGVKNMLACANTSNRHNAIFGTDDLNHGMLKGAVMDSSVGGCANAIKRKDCNTPSDRWYASAIKGIEQDTVQHMFEEKIAVQLDTLKKLGKFPKKGLDIAIDMHLIPRYDRVPGEDLTRSKYKNGTTYFERYMTVQCVNDKMRTVLAASYLKRLESVPDYVDIVLKTMAEMDIKIHLVLLDREFFSVDAISRLQENNVKFLMPCKNTGNVVAALREFAQKKREKISGNVIENNRGSATYYIMITDRKNAKDSDVPEEKYIGFATNHPTIKTEVYAKRWGIETGYGKIEECRAKTRISDMESRMLCFYYSLVLYNEWIIVRAMLSDGTERQSAMTMLTFKVQLESLLIRQSKPPT